MDRLLICFFSIIPALAPALALAQTVVVETVVLDGQTVDVQIDQQQQHEQQPPPEPAPEPREPEDIIAVGTFGFWGSGVRPRSLSFDFNSPEIQALTDLDVPDSALPRRGNSGGVTFGVGMRPTKWLRIPEIRFSFGGGALNNRWSVVDGQPDLEVALDRLWAFRIEALAGIEYEFGRVTPFLRGYGALAFYAAKAKVRHAGLGNLGSETVGDIRGELGVEAGLSVQVGGPVSVMFAYRRGLLGGSGHGAFIGWAIRGE